MWWGKMLFLILNVFYYKKKSAGYSFPLIYEMHSALFLPWKLGACDSHDIWWDGKNKIVPICKSEQTRMPGDNRIYLQIYVQPPCLPGMRIIEVCARACGEWTLGCELIRSCQWIHCLNIWLAKFSPVYNCIMLQIRRCGLRLWAE